MSRVGGLKALVKDGETGLFVDPNAPSAPNDLAALLTRLHQDPALRRGLGAAGRAEARDRYDWSQISRQLEELYLLAEENNARRLGKSR